MLKLKIGQKMLLLFVAVALVPLVIVSAYWYFLSQSSLRSAASSQQALLTSNAVTAVNQFMTDKINLLIIHSQTPGVYTLNAAVAHEDLDSLLKQDKDLENVSLADSAGMELVSTNQDGSHNKLVNVSNNDAFRAATFLSGKEYISPVSFDTEGNPHVTVAVPLVAFDTSQTLINLSTAESNVIRSGQSVKGALISTIDLSTLWSSVLSQKLGTNGYAYVVDSQGTLIAYPDNKFLASHHDLSTNPQVAAFLKNPTGTPVAAITKSEKDQEVLSSYRIVPKTQWGVIAEEPTASIFADADMVVRIGVAMGLLVAVVAVAMSYEFSRRLTKPIKLLAASAVRISQGNLDTRVQYDGSDEIGLLARAFNGMAASLTSMLHQARADSAKVNVILDNVGEGIVAVDGSGNIVVANVAAAVLVGGLPKNIIGHAFAGYFRWSKDGMPFDPPLDSPNIYRDVMLMNANGRVHYLDVLVNQINNDPLGIRAIFTIIDKTDERELENMKVDFVSMAAHELRTPMTAIRGYLSIILADAEQEHIPADTLSRLQHIQSSSVQLVGLINNLLNVSRIERGALTLHLDKVDWAKMVSDAIADQQFSAKSRNITLRFHGPADPVYILADSISVGQIINNLVSNAINYTPDGGHVDVSIESSTDGSIRTLVRDDGYGISLNAQRHLFTKFYRVVNGLSSGSGGTGLGLFISKSIAEMHGGSITVQSAENEGSTFTIELPAFDSNKFNEIMKLRPTNLNKNHGWTTKNIARRR